MPRIAMGGAIRRIEKKGRSEDQPLEVLGEDA
jgi:hypothetical protein